MKILLVLVLLAGSLTACGSLTTAELTVLGPWTGAEEQSFRAVIHDFETANHITINYTGTPAVNEVLQADVQKGQPPDVAILSSPGELARYAAGGQLRTIAGLDPNAYSGQWQTLLRLGSLDKTYAVPVKADLKSIVWFNTKTSPGLRLSNLPQLLDYTAKGAPNTWCLGMEAYSTSGWPGTDWIEDILLHQSGREAYGLWADGGLSWRSAEVQSAWRTWGQLLSAQGPQSVRSAALLTYFGDAGKQMFASQNRCLLEHQGSFAPGSYPPSTSYDFFPFPSLNPTVKPKTFEVSVNLAGLFTDNPLAGSLMTYLASGPAQAVWPAQQGSRAYSVDRAVLDAGVYKDSVSKAIVNALTTADVLCLDASDVMPAEMADAFSRAVLEYLGDPSRLDTILAGLENVRQGLANPPTLSACG